MNTPHTPLQIESALTDVRKAYRLLALYQRRILDTVMCFQKLLNNRLFSGGWSLFSNVTPRNGRGSLDCWSWDWLNMYCYEFHFPEKSDDITKLSIVHIADTGWFDTNFQDHNTKANSIDKYVNPEKSKSLFLFIAQLKGSSWKGTCVTEILRKKDFYPDMQARYNNQVIYKGVSVSDCLNEESCQKVINRVSEYFFSQVGIVIHAPDKFEVQGNT